MGNAVSVAEMAASQIVHPLIHEEKPELPEFPPGHPDIDFKKFNAKTIPPECPMHKKKPSRSECPINHEDISPLNMVLFIL